MNNALSDITDAAWIPHTKLTNSVLTKVLRTGMLYYRFESKLGGTTESDNFIDSIAAHAVGKTLY